MLELIQLRCERGARLLFDALNLSVQPGQALWVRGANGAGKTSLLRILCGLGRPARGSVRWQGESIAELAEAFRRQLLYVGHLSALKDDLSALENLMTSCHLAGLRVPEPECMRALQAAGLDRQRAQLPARLLSQGQRRRVLLARLVLAASMPLWILDEPFNALDAQATAWLAGVLRSHLIAGGCVVLTSHQPVDLGADIRPLELVLGSAASSAEVPR